MAGGRGARPHALPAPRPRAGLAGGGWARRRGCTSAPRSASEPRGGFSARVPMSACEEQSSSGTPIWVLHELRAPALLKMIKGAWKGKGKLSVLPVGKQTWSIIRFSILCAPPIFSGTVLPGQGSSADYGPRSSVGLEEAP